MSNKRASKRNFRVVYLLESLLFQSLFLLVKLFPLKSGLWLGKKLALLAYYLLARRRKVTLDNLNCARANGFLQNTDSLSVLAKNIWENLGMVGSEFLFYHSHRAQRIMENITIEGEENLKTILAKEKGAIMVTPHIGNWELIGFYLSLKGYKLCPLVKIQKNPVIDKIIQSKRRSVGIEVISRSGFLRPIIKAFQRNEIVPFLIDQADHKGIKIEFFGRTARFPRGAAEFALKKGTPLFFVYILRESPLKHRIYVSEEIKLNITGDYQTDLTNTTKQLVLEVQKVIQENPDQWLWMHKMWK